jgi:hypothetical protein
VAGRSTGQYRIEQRRGLRITRTQIRIETAAQFRPDAVPHHHTLKRFTRRADLLYVESKEIVKLDSLAGYEIGGGRRPARKQSLCNHR